MYNVHEFRKNSISTYEMKKGENNIPIRSLSLNHLCLLTIFKKAPRSQALFKDGRQTADWCIVFTFFCPANF